MIYQLKISIRNSKPLIWRRILVDAKVLLPDLHKIIQTTMGWGNSHLHQFIKGKIYYSLIDEENEDDDFGMQEDYTNIKLSDVLFQEKTKISYEYDFGDGWEHDILLEKISDEKISHPICIKGQLACPPEDCGGIWGYYNILEILKDPKHEEYESYKDWLSPDFDPEYFDLEEINEGLQEEDYGCYDWSDY